MVIAVCVAMCFACAKNNNGNVTNDSSENGDKKALNIDKDKLPYSQEEIFEQLFDINNYKVERNTYLSNTFSSFTFATSSDRPTIVSSG